MNIVVAGSRVQVYGEDVQTYKLLPNGSYDVCFNKMTGFWLTPRHDLEAHENKIYGSHARKVDKVVRSFEASDRNFGIILSGQKGIGKSLFARLLAEKCISKNIPVITVAEYIPGIADFIASIDQSVAVIFDEFEKTFGKHDDFDPQENMLSLFDGMDNGKKLFVITCNDTNKLNAYLLNRPGRFHYHFTISNPTDGEVRQYMTDKLEPDYHHLIDRIVNFSKTINMTYDYLRAIAFELNQGYSLEETLGDLNITRTEDIRFDVTVALVDGRIYTAYGQRFDLYDDRRETIVLQGNDQTRLYISFQPHDIHVADGQLILAPDKIVINNDVDDYWNLEDNERKEAIARDKARKVRSCQFVKRDFGFAARYLV